MLYPFLILAAAGLVVWNTPLKQPAEHALTQAATVVRSAVANPSAAATQIDELQHRARATVMTWFRDRLKATIDDMVR